MKKNDGVIKTKEGFSLKKNVSNELYTLVFPNGNFKELGDNLFFNVVRLSNEKIQEIIIPNNIEKIGNKCFKSCTEVKRVVIPDSVVIIGKSCFHSCKRLQYVKLSKNMKTLSECLFNSCTSLKEVQIPESVEMILDGCFYNCSSLKNISLPEGVCQIGESAFANCESLESFIFNRKIENISNSLFSGCENLEAVTLPEYLSIIGKMAFLGCYKLKELKLPYFLKTIDESAFEDCASLTSITIPSVTTQIGSHAFFNCSNLKKVTILPKLPQDKNTIVIQDNAFGECNNIEELILPKGALNNENAFDFSNMSNLKVINYAGKNILNLSEGETFRNLIYNGKLIYLEYANQDGEIVTKVLEDISSNRRDVRAEELTKQFNNLAKQEILSKNLYYGDSAKIYLNMLTVLGYKTSIALLELLKEKQLGTKSKEVPVEKNKEPRMKNEAKKDIEKRNIENIGKEAENSTENETENQESKKNIFKEKILKVLRRFFGKKHKKANNIQLTHFSTSDFIEELFESPKIFDNTAMQDFLKFFNDNLKSISEINNSSDIENLASIQRNFQAIMNNPILKKKLQTGKLTLSEVIQNKKLYIMTGYPEEFARIETETEKAHKYHESSKER